jgi:hypothetical protein
VTIPDNGLDRKQRGQKRLPESNISFQKCGLKMARELKRQSSTHLCLSDLFRYVVSRIPAYVLPCSVLFKEATEGLLKVSCCPRLWESSFITLAVWTQEQWPQRWLSKTDLAKGLHGFYASHRAPYPIKVSTLKFLYGPSYGRLSDFRSKLRRALGELTNVQRLDSWEMDDHDKVRVLKQNIKITP